MTLRELRSLAIERFGPGLERADPASLAEFLAELQPRLPGTQAGGAIVVDEAASDYVEAMRAYFAATLDGDPERVAASLWVTAAEMWVGALRSMED